METYKNYMEEIVEDMFDTVVHDLDICKCERCKVDIIAISLNNLPPKYIVTVKGEAYSKLNLLRKQFEVDVLAVMTKAAVTVNSKKRHE